MSDNSSDTKTDCKPSIMTQVIMGVSFIALMCLGFEFTKNFLTHGIVMCVGIILMILIYFFCLIVKSLIFNKNKNQFVLTYIIFIITFLINIGTLIAFIVLLFPSSVITKINNSHSLITTSPIYGFITILFIYICLTYNIYSNIMCNIEITSSNMYILFALFISICEILLIVQINCNLKSITDG